MGAALLCVVFNAVYSLYGHGITSDDMSLMFLYPLLAGALPFSILWIFAPAGGRSGWYRLFFNLYNSGIVWLTVAGLLNGIFDIAGTDSPFPAMFAAAGWVMLGTGASGGLAAVILRRFRVPS